MKTIVIYHSQTGFTRRYAQWIAEATGAECVELSAAKKMNLSPYQAIVFGSWACAGGISKLDWFKSNIDKWKDKKLIAFYVGAGPIDSPEIEASIKRNFPQPECSGIDVFYCPGGFNYEKMPAPSRLAMKMFTAVMKAKNGKTEEGQKMVKMISSSYDISDRKYIEPILKCLE